MENLSPGQKISALGTHRRLQALILAGWSQSKLGQRLGIEPRNFSAMMRREQVSASFHIAVKNLFNELWDTPPPNESWQDKGAVTRARKFARERRWLPALAWDDIDQDSEPPTPDAEADSVDEVAVLLAIRGERPRLTPAERRECVRRLHAERWSDGRIGERIGCASKTVARIREELCLAAFDQTELLGRDAA